MTQETSKRNSIYTQLLKLLLISVFTAIIAFFIMDISSELLIGNYLIKTDYIGRKEKEYIGKLQEYIDQENLSSRDATELRTWVKEQKMVSIIIYKDKIRVFDSSYPGQDIWEEQIVADYYDWEDYYEVDFSDGTAQVSIMGAYVYQFYNYALYAELILSFLLFLLLVLFGIRKKMSYIRKLSEEIEILEGGSLDYPITVMGKDELTALAEGLNSMRISFQELIQTETEIVRENQRIVTEMSHDLRTPITSIMLYTEILRKGKYQNNEQLVEFLDKIDQKARRMKQLTDHLFEYSLLTGKKEIELEEPEQYEVLFYDLLSETGSYLEQEGFQVVFRLDWVNCFLQISTDYVVRILDNITSNIVKYADPSAHVEIASVREENMAGFLVKNKTRKLEEKPESTGIGIQNIRNMMERMDGICIVTEDGGWFRMILLFPCLEI